MKADQRQRRRYLGGTVPFGWCVGDDGELVEVPEQQAVIRRMVLMRAAGAPYRPRPDSSVMDCHFSRKSQNQQEISQKRVKF
jgi:hypothetical protein